MNTTKQLYQWDINQMLVDCTGLYVDFPINGEIYRVETKDGECLIPDEFLQVEGRQKIWECMPDCTRKEFVLEIKARPMPPDYAFTPTEKLTFDGLVKRVDDAIADMIRRADSGEFDGYTPVKGKDYFTADEIKQIQDEVSSGAVGDFKSVVDTETETFNINAETKLNEFNVNAESNLTEYNSNATDKLNVYNSNAETKVTEYNQNGTNKIAEYNSNAETKIDEYNTNANNRVAEFDSHTEQIQTDISGLKNDVSANQSELAKTNLYLDALYKLNKGQTYDVLEQENEAYAVDVPSGSHYVGVDMVGGKSVVWNQLIDKNTFISSFTHNGITWTNNGDGSVTANGTATALTSFTIQYKFSEDKIVGHKFYCGGVSGGSKSTYYVRLFGGYCDYGYPVIYTLTQVAHDDLVTTALICVNRGVTVENVTFRPVFIDLTTMFGAGNEPSTVEEFEAMFPLDYYPYNEGEIISSQTYRVDVRGANIINPENLENGDMSASKGTVINSLDTFRHTDFIAIKPSTEYTFKNISVICWYDSNKKYISGENNEKTTYETLTIISPANAKYARSTLKDISKYGYIGSNPLPSPYKVQQITTNFPVLNSAGSVYDYIDMNEGKLHRRVGVVDMGNLEWVDNEGNFRTTSLKNIANLPKSNDITINALCDKFISKPWANRTIDKAIYGYYTTIEVKDSSYTDATAFKTAMNGVMLYYELAEELITDITITAELTNWLTVETGGSITFHNTDEGKRMLIPNKLSFIRKLDEVTV